MLVIKVQQLTTKGNSKQRELTVVRSTEKQA